MADNSSAFDIIKHRVGEAMEVVIRDAREEIIAEAVKQFEKEVRVDVARAALAILNVYSVEHMGNQILIRVDIKGGSDGR
jgi:hypothetical protein